MLGAFTHAHKGGLVLSGLLAAALFTDSASAAVIAAHIGDTDPTTGSPTEWVKTGGGDGTPVAGSTPAWNLTRSAGPMYVYAMDATEHAAAHANGWTLSAYVRVNDVDVPLQSGDLGSNVEYATDGASGSQRWFMTFGADANGDPMVKVGFHDQPTDTLVGGAGSFNLYQLIYDPTTATADLFVNGDELRSDISAPYSSTLSRVGFGSNNGGDSQVHDVDWAMARLEVVPEPATAALVGLGLLAMGIRRQRALH